MVAPYLRFVQLPHRQALRYVQPLREGGSLPAIVDTMMACSSRYLATYRAVCAGDGAAGPLALAAPSASAIPRVPWRICSRNTCCRLRNEGVAGRTHSHSLLHQYYD